MKSISDDDLCSDCAHCAYVQEPDRHACAHAFPGVTGEDDYVVTCVKFQARSKTRHDLVRAAVAAKQAHWDALIALERSYPQELTDNQNDVMCERIDLLAAAATGSISDESVQEVLNAIASA